MEELNYNMIKREHEQKFQAVCQAGDYADILKIFNEKVLPNPSDNISADKMMTTAHWC